MSMPLPRQYRPPPSKTSRTSCCSVGFIIANSFLFIAPLHGSVVAGGIIPEDDRPKLLDSGVAAVFTPKDFELTRIVTEIAELALAARG